MQKYSFEIFIQKTKEKFGEKFSYIKTEQQFSLQNKIDIVCPDHGNFSMTGINHLHSKFGCPICGEEYRRNVTSSRNSSQKIPWEIHFKKLTEMYSDRYEFDENLNYVELKTKIDVVCKKHGIFKKHLFVLLNNKVKHQCQKCRYEETKIYKSKNKTEDEILKKKNESFKNKSKSKTIPFEDALIRFKSAHGEKFEYIKEFYFGLSKPIKFICKKHGLVQSSSANEHIKSTYGCPLCATSNKSKKEEIWLDFHNIEKRQHRVNINNKRFTFDGYDEKTNTIYEFLGDYWHGHTRYFINDANKINIKNGKLFSVLFDETKDRFDILVESGYNVVYVWESDVKTDLSCVRIYSGTLET